MVAAAAADAKRRVQVLEERVLVGIEEPPLLAGITDDHLPAEHEPCPVGSDRALENAIMTDPEARDPALLAKLDAVAGRVLRR